MPSLYEVLLEEERQRADPSRLETTTGSGHPETSQQAAERAFPKSGTNRWRVLQALLHVPGGMTDEELTDYLDLPANSERPRRNELVRDGWVEDSGKRKLTASGTPAIVWRAIP